MERKCFAVLFFILSIISPAYAYDDGDFQVWTTEAEEFQLNKNWKLAFEEEFRWADNASEFFYQHYDAGVSCAANKNLNLGGGYRQVYELRNKKFLAENEPYLTLTAGKITMC